MHSHTQSCTMIHDHAQSCTTKHNHAQLCCSLGCVCVSVSFCVPQDTSTGQIIAQHRTKMGPCDVLRHNPYNAVSLLGHAQGVVTMWTPNMTSPAVKMLAHRVSCLAYSHAPGHTLCTAWPAIMHLDSHSVHCLAYNHAPGQSLCALLAHYVSSCTSLLVTPHAVSVWLVLDHLGFLFGHGACTISAA